jgi:SAM-dependent methyltransferase
VTELADRSDRAPMTTPAPLGWIGVRLDRGARVALAALGDVLREPDRAWSDDLRRGAPIEVGELSPRIGASALAALVDAGLAAVLDGHVWLATTISDVGGVLTAIPKHGWGDEIVYLGQDSTYLVEAALRLAPRGERAADLGTGTGLAAAVLASRYRVVMGTDLAPSVTTAAALTLALNHYPDQHRVGLGLADVASGLRTDAFDLVVANAPWVPLAPGSAAPRELFAHGGDLGVELPARFLRDGATLLRAGGVAITLALDVEVDQRFRPLRAACDDLVAQGYVVNRLATPFNRDRPHLAEVTRQRQPDLTAATHVAVVVARARADDPTRASLQVAVDALRRRWDQASTAAEP